LETPRPSEADFVWSILLKKIGIKNMVGVCYDIGRMNDINHALLYLGSSRLLVNIRRVQQGSS